MTTILDVAKIAQDVYRTGGEIARSHFTQNPSTGFQGAVFDTPAFKVVAFKGTHNGADLWSDFQLAVGDRPDQLTDAAELFAAAAEEGGKQILLTGHSLGGALAQALGYDTDTPFITFNAPPMATNMVNTSWFRAIRSRAMSAAGRYGGAGGLLIGALAFSVMSKASQIRTGDVKKTLGLNVRLSWDPVSSSYWGGGHVGNVIETPAPSWCLNRHGMANVIASLEGPGNFVGGMTISA